MFDPAWVAVRQAGASNGEAAGEGSVAITIYGIKNCDTMKKARAWLAEHGVPYAFHDYKAEGIERARLEGWAKKVGWEKLLNRAGTTFRGLAEQDKQGLDAAKAIQLMLAQPSLIKRPVLELGGGRVLVGFQAEVYDRDVPRK
jgi:arsenate reductase